METKLIKSLAFEELVTRYLIDSLNEIGKEVILYNNTVNSKGFDAYLPGGLSDSNKETYLIIKKIDSKKGEYFKYIDKEFYKFRDENIQQILLVLGNNFSDDAKDSIRRMTESRAHTKVIVWDETDVLNRIDQNSSLFKEYIENPHKSFTNSVFTERSSIDKKNEKQENLLHGLKNKYKQEEVTLMLGAGVSIDAGIPLWDDLVNTLLSKMIESRLVDEDEMTLKNHLLEIIQLANSNKENSPLTQMRYIKSAFTQIEYNKLVHSVLYELNPNPKTKLIETIVSLCSPKRNHIGVKSIITYNFDDLLENALNGNKLDYNLVCTERDSYVNSQLNIYHVHGYLPKECDELNNDLGLVFSEEDYHKVYRDSFSWTNLVQLNAFRENTCLFIGCSLNDPNMRRLLDVAAKNLEQPKHFALMKRSKLAKKKGITKSAYDIFYSIDDSIREKYYASIGINIIWYDEYSDLPIILNSLMNEN